MIRAIRSVNGNVDMDLEASSFDDANEIIEDWKANDLDFYGRVPEHVTYEIVTPTRLQFISDGRDITNQMYAEVDADEVRAWDEEICLLSVKNVHAEIGAPGQVWEYESSDYGHAYSDELLDRTFESWRDAFDAFGINYGQND